MASARVILKLIRQRLRVAVSREENWCPTILSVICLYLPYEVKITSYTLAATTLTLLLF